METYPHTFPDSGKVRNSFGVVDHTVIRPSGQRVYVPMRLIVNGEGCELLFTLYREPNMSGAQFASDAAFVQARPRWIEEAPGKESGFP